MPDERQPGQDAPMWPTDDEDRGAAEASTPKSPENKPAESKKHADQPKPAAPSEPLWPTDDEEDPDEAPAKPAEPAAEEPPEEPAKAPADAEVTKPTETPEAPAEPEVIKPAESETAGQRPEENKPAGSEDTARVAAEDITRPPSTDEVNKPAEPAKADPEPADAPDETEPSTSTEPDQDEPAAATVNKPADSESPGQRPEVNKPAESAEAEREASRHVEDRWGIKPADSETTGQGPEENKPAESTEREREASGRVEDRWGTKPAESVDAGQQPEVNKPAESVEAEREAARRVEDPWGIKPAEAVDAGQRPGVNKPAESAEGEREALGRVDDPWGVKPADSETAGQPPEVNKPAESVEVERDVSGRVEDRWGIKPAGSETAGQRPEVNKPAESVEVERDVSGRVEDRWGIKPAGSEGTGQRVEEDKPAGFAEGEREAPRRGDEPRGIKPAGSFRWVGEADPEQTVPTDTERDEEAQSTADLRIPADRRDHEAVVEDEEDDDSESTQSVAVDDVEEDDHQPDDESTQRVATTGEQPALLRRYVEDTQVIDLRALQSPRRPGPPPPSSPLQRPQQQRPQGPPGPQRQGPPRPSGPPPGRVIPPVGPPRARPMRIEPRQPEPESPAERTEMFRLEPPPRREQLQRREPEPLPPHREMLQRKAAEPEEYDDLYDRLYDEDDEDDDVPAPRRRRRKGLLITLLSLVVVLAVAAGVVFFVPGVANKLGLKGANDVAIAPPPAPVAFIPQLKGPDPQAPNPTQSGVAQAIEGPASASTLGTLTGVVVDPANGTVLWDRNSDTGLTPASTGKLLTSAAALLSLDHTTQFVTRVVQGDQPGTVILVGGGDLTLNSLPPGEDSVYPGSAHVADLIAQVKKATGGKVTKVLIDVHRYSGPLLAPGWDPKDVAAGYQTPMEPVMMDGGRADPTEPEKSARSARPARAVATKIAEAFGATVPENATATAKANAPVLGEVRSAPLVELIDNLLQISDNMLAEGVLREVAKQNGEEVSYAGGVRAVRKVLQDNGFDVSGYQMVDGSGLSKQDKATAKLLADVLTVAAGPDGKDPRTAKLRPLLGGLPVAGGSGTLNPRFQDAKSKEGKGWVRAKTGTLTGVNTLAGVVLDKDGRVLVFALMSNNGDGAKAPPALDAVAARLRECGCG